jgi:uncharacterized protein HemX
MADALILIVSLLLGAVLYIVMRQRVDNLERQLNEHEINDKRTGHIIVQLLEQLNTLTAAHNEVADALNNQTNKQEEFEWDLHMPFKNPKGEA